MDPAGLGALLGFSAIVGIYLFRKVCDVYEARKRRKETPIHAQIKTQTSTDSSLLLRAQHVKIRTILPPLKTKTIFLKNLNSHPANRQLLSIDSIRPS
jgi:hypothetical protein